jgi:hypothetical protein
VKKMKIHENSIKKGVESEFYGKKGYKYSKYRAATLFIIQKGYEEFLKIADTWKNQYG